MSQGHSEPTIIGRIDRADFTRLNLTRIEVKTDTGAYTSSFHCSQIEETPKKQLRVIFLDPDHPKYSGAAVVFDDYAKRSVKSSNGEVEDRFIISTEICFFDRTYVAEFSLTNRSGMKYPVLIGRKFLTENNFVVDPKLRNYLYRQKQRSKRPPET